LRDPLRLLVLVGVLVTALAASGTVPAAPARTAANECRGLPVCVPIAGPWVVVPARQGGRPATVEYLLSCPRGFVVAGTDALVAHRATDVSIRGEPGSPVAPGVTVGRDVLFTAVHTGVARAPTSFRPFLGCVPTTGGGGRSQTVYAPRTLFAVHPMRPIVRTVRVGALEAGATSVVVARCAPGGRLLGGSHAVGFYTKREPTDELLAAVRARQNLGGGRVVARASIALPSIPRAELQVQALCTKGGR
jgi:hypothetical protein